MLCFYVSKSNVLAEHSRKMDESKNDEKFGNHWVIQSVV